MHHHSLAALTTLALLVAGCSSESRRDPAASAAVPATPGMTTAPVAAPVAASPSASQDAGPPTARTLYYDFDNDLIHDSDLPALQKNARYLSAHPGVTVTIEGNCDERGSDDYNIALGERRALAAKKLLEGYGVGAQQITVVSYGKEKPRATCHDEGCWKQNRRSDLVYRSG